MAKLTMHRSRELNNKIRIFKIHIDGKQVGEIRYGETIDFEVTPGRHEVVAKVDWCRSQVVEFEVTEDQTKVFGVAGFKYGDTVLPLVFGIPSMYYAIRTLIGVEYKFLLILALVALAYPTYYLSFGRSRYLRLIELE